MLYPIELRVQNASRLKCNRLGNRPDVKHGLVEDLTTIDACSSTAMLRYGNQPTKSCSGTVNFNGFFDRMHCVTAGKAEKSARQAGNSN